jgi:hypothetical protein
MYDIFYKRHELLSVYLLIDIRATKYSVIQKDGLDFVRLYFLNYTWYVNDVHNI